MLVIKRRISLEFLGEEYKDSYISVKAISVKEYPELKGTVQETIIDRFLEGKINQDGTMVDVTKDNIEELPGEVFVEAFNTIVGIENPKD